MISQICLIIAIIYTIIAGKYKLALLDMAVLILNISFAGFMGKDVDK